MPHSESVSGTFSMMWLMALGVIVCAVLKSPFGFLFLFALVWCFFSVVKQLTTTTSKEDDSADGKDVEMQPLGKITGDMTLGEVLARY